MPDTTQRDDTEGRVAPKDEGTAAVRRERRADRMAAHARASRKDLSLLHSIAVNANEARRARDAVAFVLEEICRGHGWTVGHAYLLRSYPDLRLRPVPSLWRCSEPARFERLRRLTEESSFEIGKGMVGTVARRRTPLWIERVADASPPIRFTDDRIEARSGILVPVTVGAEPTAVAVLEFYSANHRRTSAARLHLTASVGSLLGRVFERERLEQKLAERREAEQRRIGRELHDTVSQELTGITMMAERLGEQLEEARSPVMEDVQKLADHIARVRAKVHALSRGLLPIEIEAHGVRQALDYLATSTREVHGLDCRVDCDDDVDIGDKVVANQLVRIAQEAMQNAAKHARARVVEVALSRRDERLTLTVTDDGVGFSPEQQEGGVGLRLMRQRAASIGAELTVSSRAGRGTRVCCDWRP